MYIYINELKINEYRYENENKVLTLGSGIILPSLINSAKPSSCENA